MSTAVLVTALTFAQAAPAPLEERLSTAEIDATLLAAAKGPSDAPMVHALAIEAELARAFPRALALLRQAARLDPGDGVIAFDLARLALLHDGTAADLEPFWRSDNSGDEADRLRGAVAVELGREVPGAGAGAGAAEGRDAWYDARLRAGLSVDSNLAIAADDAPSHLSAARIAAGGVFDFKPLRDWLALDLSASLDVGKYLSDSPRVTAFDADTFGLGARFVLERDPILLTVSANGTEIASGNFSRQYLASLDGDADLRFALGRGHLGIYAGGGGRDFGDRNPEGTSLDRDGGLMRAGIAWDLGAGVFSLQSRIGWAAEYAEGRQFRVQAVSLYLVGRLALDGVEAVLGVSDEVRMYRESFDGIDTAYNVRTDNRLSPFAQVSLQMSDSIWAFASYGFTHNLSRWVPEEEPLPGAAFVDTNKQDFNYVRHLAQAGVEVRL